MPSAQLDFDSTHSSTSRLHGNRGVVDVARQPTKFSLVLLPRTGAVRAAVSSVNQMPRLPRLSSGNFNMAIKTITSSNCAMCVSHGFHMRYESSSI